MSWSDQCPLYGNCSECGLVIEWSQVIHLSRSDWLFEHNWRWAPWRGLVGTMRRCFRPAIFWRDLKLTDHIRIGPVCFLSILFVLMPIVWMTLWHAWQWHSNLVAYPRSFSRPPTFTGVYVIDLILVSLRFVNSIWFGRNLCGPLVVLFGMPFLFILLPSTLRKAKVNGKHVLRIGLYSLIAPMSLWLAWSVIFELTWVTGWWQATWWWNPWSWVYHFGPAERYFTLIWTPLVGIMIALGCAWWVSIWWRRACVEYLMLPNSRGIIRVFVLILVIAAVIVQMLTNMRDM